jgi:hypothetical protein
MSEQVTLWTRLYTFNDEQFMTVSEKWQVLNAWKHFIRSGFRYSRFTQAIYEFLINSCAFIAHYNRYRFWSFYFDAEPESLLRLIEQFGGSRQSAELWGRWWLDGPTGADLKQAMCSEIEIVYEALVSALNLRAPRVTESQRSRLAAAASAAFKAHEERLASVRRVSPGFGKVGAQLSLWDMVDTPPATSEAPLALEMAGIGEEL